MHEDEIAIDDDVVRELIASQFPQWGQEPVRRVLSHGTVNAIFRIGEDVAARFPLLGADPAATRQLLKAEARAGAEFARHSPFPAPIPLALGDPGPGYPLPWSVQTWLTGTVASDADPSGSEEFARDLAALLTALRAAGTEGRMFTGANRGGDLQAHDEWVDTCLRNSVHLLDVPRLATLWEYFRDLPRAAPDVMSHGDLIPANLLVTEGRLTGVLDCGGFAPADPALDLIAGWHLLDDRARTAFRAALACDDLEWERSKAWAFQQALGAVWYYIDTNPAMATMGQRTLARIIVSTRT